ncbi:hypothetical protein LPTSP1_04190 [Leptospira johnsonii]|uniref:Uncharacterized protein n=1 Tax=Leptospira johnsonii TaxID=1917820 RepID=A0A2P2CYF0_9LEPT|nr:hypothetical protein LPTSP1_04190 [Leptospira johnsonii]
MKTASTRICQIGVPPSKIFAKDSRGQCHKYKGKLIKPKNIEIGFPKTLRLNLERFPELISNTAPNTGTKARNPGNADPFLIRKIPKKIHKIPNTD